MYDKLRKFLLLFLAIVVLLFSVLYLVMGRQTYLEYDDALFSRSEEGGRVIYTAQVDGQPAILTVEGDCVITYQLGNTIYGPYTIRDEPAAAPDTDELAGLELTGIEIWDGEALMFRGGYVRNGYLTLFDESGQAITGFGFSVNGSTYDSEGNLIDPHEPTAHNLLFLAQRPEADVHRGAAALWWIGTLFAAIAALIAWFFQPILRFNLAFYVKEPESAEPSALLIFNLGLVLFVSCALSIVFYTLGLVRVWPL